MTRGFRTFAALTALLLTASAARAADPDLFVLDVSVPSIQAGSNKMIDLMEDFVKREGDFGSIPAGTNFGGSLNYLGIPNAIQLDVDFTDPLNAIVLTLQTVGGTVENFSVPTGGCATPDACEDLVYEQLEDWIKKDGVDAWAAFLQESNARSQLALLSGNPRSSVALMGDSAYRKFGFDDSRSRMGYGKSVKRFGGFELRVDAGVSSVNTAQFGDDLWTFDPMITLAGNFGRHVGLSFSIVGQYRDYNGAQMADLGFELGLPLTLTRPDRGGQFWQVTPFLQAAGGASIDAAAGGLFMGGGLVNALGFNNEHFEVLMANEIAYYNGIPIDSLGGYDFATELSQLYFKNGLEGTFWMVGGFYADAGLHFTNFAVDDAAVSWYVTPAVGVGWQAGRWMDVRVAYEADLDNNDYKAHNLQVKLDLLF